MKADECLVVEMLNSCYVSSRLSLNGMASFVKSLVRDKMEAICSHDQSCRWDRDAAGAEG